MRPRLGGGVSRKPRHRRRFEPRALRVGELIRHALSDLLTRGEVHDPTARRMGGVAGHAGIFTTATDLLRYARMILAGGELAHRTTVTEDYLLDLEREAFLKLCGERKTLERIQHTLKTGKPLRN